MSVQPSADDEFLTPAAVAALLYVDPKTVTRWAKAARSAQSGHLAGIGAS